jgi:hypothetical protein
MELGGTKLDFNYWDLGQQSTGATVEINLTGTEANVRLLDASNYSAYKRGDRHSYYGGHYKQSPIRLQVPATGHWFVTVDYGGFAGSGTAAVRVLGRVSSL